MIKKNFLNFLDIKNIKYESIINSGFIQLNTIYSILEFKKLIKEFLKISNNNILFDFKIKKNLMIISLLYLKNNLIFDLENYKIFFNKNEKIKSFFLFYFNTNILISINGCDGVGKSYIINKLKEELLRFNLKFSYYHFPIKFLYKNKPKNNPYSDNTYNNFFSFFKILYIFTDNFIKILILKYFYNDYLIIIDRGPIDIIVDPLRLRIKKNNFYKFLNTKFLFIFNIINHSILLVSNPKQIWQRTKQTSINQIKINQSSYKSIFLKLGPKYGIINLDTEQKNIIKNLLVLISKLNLTKMRVN